MTRRILVAAVAVGLAACGGSSSDGSNAAASKVFTYGGGVSADSTQMSAVQPQVTEALALKSSPDASTAQNLADFSGVTSALLGSSGVGYLQSSSSPQQRAVALARAASGQLVSSGSNPFDDASCATTTTTSVKMANCTITFSESGFSGTAVVNGSFVVASAGSVTWDLAIQVNVSGSGFSGSGRYQQSGNLTVTADTVKGQMLAEIAVSASGNGQSASLDVAESLDMDLTYQSDPSCVTGGTLEAKRVWKTRPSGSTATDLPDRGAKVTWTGCGQGTIAFST